MIDFAFSLNELENQGNLRKIPPIIDGNKGFFDFSSNDYMGLARVWKDFVAEFVKKYPDYGFSSSASRLLSSRQEIYYKLESYLQKLYSRDILLFNSGYHANVGIIGALSLLPSTIFICDKQIHASIIDGLKISGAEFKRFPHNDINALKKIIANLSCQHKNIIIVVESIYSMEGDCAPLDELVKLKREIHDIALYVDEAHAFGVRGDKGLGIAEELNLIEEIDFIIGTFGKASASTGAFAATSSDAKQFFINKSRPFIFSTALPPINIAWSLFMIEKLTGMQTERKQLKDLGLFFRERIEEITETPNPSKSQIIPLITGDSHKATRISQKLKKNYNIIALPIRRPTVLPGRECLRFSINLNLSMSIEAQLKQLNEVSDNIAEVYNKFQ